jgi:hypothetical protein
MPSPDIFNTYFGNLGKQKHSLITAPLLLSQIENTCLHTLFLQPTDPQEVYKIIMKLKNSNSAGYDGITHKIVRHCARHICEPMSEFINSSLSEGLFPQELKQTVIRPIFKDGLSNLPGNWSPIANVSTYSKMYEHVFLNRLINLLSHNNLLCREQFGFTRGRNTTDAMVDFITKVVTALDFFLSLKKYTVPGSGRNFLTHYYILSTFVFCGEPEAIT